MVKQKQKIKKKVVAKKSVGKKVVRNKPRVDLRQLRNAKKKSKSKPKPKPKTKAKPEVKQDSYSMFDNERDIDKDITDASEESDKMLKEIFNVKN